MFLAPTPEHAGCYGDACGFLTSNGIVICIFPQDDHEKNTCSLFPKRAPPKERWGSLVALISMLFALAPRPSSDHPGSHRNV